MNRCLIVRHVFNIVLLLLLLRYYVHRSLPHSCRTVLHVLRRNTGTHTVTEDHFDVSDAREHAIGYGTSDEREEKTQDERRTDHCRRRHSAVEDDPTNGKKESVAHGVHRYGIWLRCLAELNEHAAATSHRTTEKKDPHQPNLFNTILMNLNGSPQFR